MPRISSLLGLLQFFPGADMRLHRHVPIVLLLVAVSSLAATPTSPATNPSVAADFTLIQRLGTSNPIGYRILAIRYALKVTDVPTRDQLLTMILPTDDLDTDLTAVNALSSPDS